ncbi:TonB-dependent siderophore receptor, partial [Cupriavidus sp. SIMBA_020]
AAAAVALASLSVHAYAADATSDSATTDSAKSSVLPAVSVKAARAALPGDLAPAYAGGQVASGASIGVLGKQKMLDVPFSVT